MKYGLPTAHPIEFFDEAKNKHYRIDYDGGVRYWCVHEKRGEDYYLVYTAYNEEQLLSKFKSLKKYIDNLQFKDELKQMVNNE